MLLQVPNDIMPLRLVRMFQELFDQHVFPGLYAIESQLCPQLNIRTACLDGTPCSMYCSPMTTLGLGLYCFRCPHLRRPRSSSLI
jgi:hypothetical protein